MQALRLCTQWEIKKRSFGFSKVSCVIWWWWWDFIIIPPSNSSNSTIKIIMWSRRACSTAQTTLECLFLHSYSGGMPLASSLFISFFYSILSVSNSTCCCCVLDRCLGLGVGTVRSSYLFVFFLYKIQDDNNKWDVGCRRIGYTVLGVGHDKLTLRYLKR